MSVAPPDPSASAAGEAPRIRFLGVRVVRAPNGRSRVEVELRPIAGGVVMGCAEAEPSVFCDQRAAAIATADALGRANAVGVRFEVSGVKNVRAFDQAIVLVQLVASGGVDPSRGPQRLVGASVGDDDLVAATVRAVLNASNRVLWMRAPILEAEAPARLGQADHAPSHAAAHAAVQAAHALHADGARLADEARAVADALAAFAVAADDAPLARPRGLADVA